MQSVQFYANLHTRTPPQKKKEEKKPEQNSSLLEVFLKFWNWPAN